MKSELKTFVCVLLLCVLAVAVLVAFPQKDAYGEGVYLQLGIPHSVTKKDRQATIAVMNAQKLPLVDGRQRVQITIQYSYLNAKDMEECRCFSDWFSVILFSGNVSCNEIYLTTRDTREHANTFVRNGGTIAFDIAFDAPDLQEPLQLVLIPIDAESSKDYLQFDLH